MVLAETRDAGAVAVAEGAALVTVVIPTFNRVRFLSEAIESALAQTYPRVEIVVSDDASSEDVYGAVVSRFEGRGVKYRRNPQNVGMGANIWTALAAANGKYVATIHDDDTWEPDFLASLVPALEADDSVSVAFSDHHVMNEDGSLNPELSDENTRHWYRHELARGTIDRFLSEVVLHRNVVPAAMAALFRKSAIDWTDFPDGVGTFYDLWITYLSARTGARAYYEPRRLTRYRVHNESETRSWGSSQGRLRALRQSEFVLHRYLEDQALRQFRSFIERQYARTVGSLVFALLENDKGDELAAVLSRAEAMIKRPDLRAMMMVGRLPGVIRRPIGRVALEVRRFLRGPSRSTNASR
jgi:glycosyltransferase involved in cell wall biosynthesis